jgi:predicted enzyme related to lactoylglutathione lyase
MAGEIVHLEIPSRSFERSAPFYAKLFGWRTDGQQAGGHLRFELSGAPAEAAASTTTGSLVRSALAQATGPLPFIAVDDVEETLAEAERQGGRVLGRNLPLAGHGQYGLLADLDGNVIAVVEAAGGNGAGTAEKRKAKDAAPKPPLPAKPAAKDSKESKDSKKAAAAPATKPVPKPASKPISSRKR